MPKWLPLNRYFTHFESRCGSFDQLLPRKREIHRDLFLSNPPAGDELTLFFHNFKLSLGNGFFAPSFVDWIHLGYLELLPQLQKAKDQKISELEHLYSFQPAHERAKQVQAAQKELKAECEILLKKWEAKLKGRLKKQFQDAIASNISLAAEFFNKIIFAWWDRKLEDFAVIPYKESLLLSELNHNSEEAFELRANIEKAHLMIDSALAIEGQSSFERLGHLRKFLEGIFDHYAEFCFQCTSSNIPPEVHLIPANPDENALGEYNLDKHRIDLFITPQSLAKMLQLAATFLEKGKSPFIDEAHLLFIKQGMSGVVNHEIRTCTPKR